MTDVLTIASYGIRESVRRRVFVVVAILTLASGILYILGAKIAFHDTQSFSGGGIADTKDFTGATVFGMAMFGSLFLGAVLAAFLTLGVIRGDSERGLLQPLVVRPVGRATVLASRFGAAAIVSGGYVVIVYTGALLSTAIVGDWWPDHIVRPALGLVGGVVVISAISTAGSVVFTATANGIAVFMIYGAGLIAGLLGQIGDALQSQNLQHISSVATWILPFEALFQDGLNATVANTGGLTGALLDLGPFGGAHHAGALLWPYTVVYVAGVIAAATWAFARRDL
ncbi:MAG TPA: ABC transporter permease subunit [Thermoleophilaceae bacterium]|jgi:ABC-type transport system involved in multi-copper enzyme maturation permease subunit|nr:ABC transporter permease subunit [Thermoleophilaceae bacterium]